MKKVIVLGIVLTMVMGLAAVASAADEVDANWLVQLKAMDSSNLNAGAYVTLGTKTGASNGFVVAEDTEATAAVSTAVDVVCTDLGGAARWAKDQRAPMVLGDMYTWNLRVAGNSEWGLKDIVLKGWVPTAYKLDGKMPTVTLFNGKTKLWDVVAGTSGTASAPNFTVTLPYLANGYDLTLVANTVPEPGSIVAMLSGLVGLAGFGIRRRK